MKKLNLFCVLVSLTAMALFAGCGKTGGSSAGAGGNSQNSTNTSNSETMEAQIQAIANTNSYYISQGNLLSFDQWTYEYNQAGGITFLDPASTTIAPELAAQSLTASSLITLDQWCTFVSAAGVSCSSSAFTPFPAGTLGASLLVDAQPNSSFISQDSRLTFAQWNYFYNQITTLTGPNAGTADIASEFSSYGLVPGTDTMTLALWCSFVAVANISCSGAP